MIHTNTHLVHIQIFRQLHPSILAHYLATVYCSLALKMLPDFVKNDNHYKM